MVILFPPGGTLPFIASPVSHVISASVGPSSVEKLPGEAEVFVVGSVLEADPLPDTAPVDGEPVDASLVADVPDELLATSEDDELILPLAVPDVVEDAEEDVEGVDDAADVDDDCELEALSDDGGLFVLPSLGSRGCGTNSGTT